MTNDRVEKPGGPQIGIFLVAHTNVGKTTLLRTLLGQDVGDIEDAPDVTQATMAYDLIVDQHLGALRLWDTPGFGDSFRLAKRLRQEQRWIAWCVREIWDRVFHRKLWQCQRLALDLRARASVILYPVNLQERPFEAVYVAPELQVLAWVGKPVLALLNQGGPDGEVSQAERVAEWRAHLANFAAVRGVANLDAYTRCWVQEVSLFNKIGQVLPDSTRPGYLQLAASLGQTYADRLDASVAAISDYLVHLAREKVELEAGWFDDIKDIWGTLRKSIPWGKSNSLSPLESAMQGLAQRYAEASKAVTDKLIAINRLDGEAAADIMHMANTKLVTDKPFDGATAAVLGGVMSGILTGLAADLLAGGMTLGTGALVGGVLGMTGGAALAAGYNVGTSKDKKVVAWSPGALTEAFEKSLMLYLAVAHFGRGQGQWRAREAPQAWRDAVRDTVSRSKEPLQAVWRSLATHPKTASAPDDCTLQVRIAIRDVLLAIHPDSNALLLEPPGQAAQ